MSSALLRRIATAAVLIPAFVSLVWFAPAAYLHMVFALVVFLGALEWSAFGTKDKPACWLFAFSVVAFLYATYAAPAETRLLLLKLSVGFWMLVTVWLIAYQRTRLKTDWLSTSVAHLGIGVAVLVPAWLAMVSLPPKLVLILFVVVWFGDTGAYFCGRAWGRRKLASAISPGKTWAGFYGAVVLGAIAGPSFAWALNVQVGQPLGFVVVCAITVIVSVVGDLTESQFKRMAGVKDSGTLLPGHGGVLDRIDSLTAAAPVFVVGVYLLGVAI